MASIATLAVQLTLQTAAFSKGINKSQRELLNFSQTVSTIGRNLTRFGVILTGAVSAGLLLAAKAGAEFEQSMARVDAITQATIEQFVNLTRAARDMGQQTVFTATQAAEALREFSQAGFTVREALTALRPTLDFAVAGNLDIAEAADIAARILRGLGLQAEDLATSLNVLSKAFTLAPVTVEELGEAFKFVAPVGRAAGKEIEELTAVLTIFARAGLRGEQAGTALRNILLRLQAQPSEVKKALDQLGITVADETGKLKSLADIFEDVRIATANLTEVQRQSIISRIAGIRATAAFSAAMAAGADEVRALERELSLTDDTMKRIADRQLVTVTSRLLLLKSAATELLLVLNDRFAPTLKQVIDLSTEAVKNITTWVEENEKLAIGIGIATVALGAITIAQGAMATAFVVGTAAVTAFNIALGTGAVVAAASFLAAVGPFVVVGAIILAAFASWVIVIHQVISGLEEAESRLEALNQTQEKVARTSNQLSNINKSMLTLEQKLNEARKTGNRAQIAELELAIQNQLVRADEERFLRTQALVRQRERLGQLAGAEEKILSVAANKLRESVKLQEELRRKAALAREDAIIENAIREAAVAAAAEERAQADATAIIIKEQQRLLSEKNAQQGAVISIYNKEQRALEQVKKALSEAAIAEGARVRILREAERKLEEIRNERLRILEKERQDRIRDFSSTEKELAFLRLRAQKNELLKLAQNARERLMIERGFLLKKKALIERFDKDEDRPEAPTAQPGAFREGTVEFFKAAFGGANPLLEENKKQTKELEDVNDKLQDVEDAIKDEGGIGQAVIDV